jgi:hypothetical protein
MYIHASQIVYRAFKRRVFSAEIAKSIHSQLRKRWERLQINDKPQRGDTDFILSIGRELLIEKVPGSLSEPH